MEAVVYPTAWQNLIVRDATPGEEDALVALMNAAYRAAGRGQTFSPAQYQQLLTGSIHDPQQDRRIIATQDGQPVGLGQILNRSNYTRLNLGLFVHPDHLGRDLEGYLLSWGELRARELVRHAPAGETVYLVTSLASGQTETAALLADHGFQLVRHFLELHADLDVPPAPPTWPAGFTVRTLRRGQEELVVYRVMDETFEDHWDHVHVPEAEGFARFLQLRIEGSPDFDPTLWFLVCTQNEAGAEAIAAYAICDRKGWINLLGVRRAYRRQGLASALVHHAFGEFYRRGIHQARLSVDGASPTGAVGIYHRAGMHTANQTDVYFKELRGAV
jgi:GNAT superfamily N-acetyltransferase